MDKMTIKQRLIAHGKKITASFSRQISEKDREINDPKLKIGALKRKLAIEKSKKRILIIEVNEVRESLNRLTAELSK